MDALIESLNELLPEYTDELFKVVDGYPVFHARTDVPSLIRTYIAYGPMSEEKWAEKSKKYPHLFAPVSVILNGVAWSSWETFQETCWSADWKRQLNMWVEIRIATGRWLSRKEAREQHLISLPLIEEGTGQTRSEIRFFYERAIAICGLQDLHKEETK